MSKLKLAILLSVFIFTISANASAPNNSFGPVKIVKVSVSDFKILVVDIEPNAPNQHVADCDDSRKNQLVIDPASPYEKEMFSIALVAMASGKKISGWVNGCHIYGNNYRSPKMTVIGMEK